MVYVKRVFLLTILCFSGFSLAVKKDDISYPGVVNLSIFGHSAGRAFFISPDLMVAAFHSVDQFKGILDTFVTTFSFIDPVTKKLIPVTEFVALDDRHDLAILRAEGYQSEIYYPINLSETGDGTSVPSLFLFAPFSEGILKLKVVKRSIFGENSFTSAEVYEGEYKNSNLIGNSGTPVFSEDDSYPVFAGVFVAVKRNRSIKNGFAQRLSKEEKRQKVDLVYVSVDRVRDLLLRPYKDNCMSSHCILKAKARTVNQAENGDENALFYLGREVYHQAMLRDTRLSSTISEGERTRHLTFRRLEHRQAARFFYSCRSTRS